MLSFISLRALDLDTPGAQSAAVSCKHVLPTAPSFTVWYINSLSRDEYFGTDTWIRRRLALSTTTPLATRRISVTLGGGAHYIQHTTINNSTSDCWTYASSYAIKYVRSEAYLLVSNVITRCQAYQARVWACAQTSARILLFLSTTQPSYLTPQAPSILYPSRALSVLFDPLRATNAFTQYVWSVNTSQVGEFGLTDSNILNLKWNKK